jgi:phosphatidylglycerol lysyltransferase
MGLLAVFGGWRLLRPAAGEPPPPTDDELARVAEIVERSPHSSAYLALLGDKYFLFDRDRTGFVMYAIEGRSWVALGDPVGPPEVVKPLIWQFRELSDRHGAGRCSTRPAPVPAASWSSVSICASSARSPASTCAFTLEAARARRCGRPTTGRRARACASR